MAESEENMEKLLKELKKKLLNKEMNFFDLDNFMMENGFYSVFDDGSTYEIKNDKNVIYTSKNFINAIKIDFEITKNNAEDEVEEWFLLLVTDIQVF